MITSEQTVEPSGVIAGDGLAAVAVGNVLLTLWRSSASFERWRGFVMPQLDGIVAAHPEGIVLVQLILPSSGPPDATTRAALQADLRRLGPQLRRVVTVAIGDSFRQKIVRTIVRTMLLVGGLSKQQRVCATIGEALDAVLADVAPGSLSVGDLNAAVDALYVEIGSPRDG
jgi:hypothetical protein